MRMKEYIAPAIEAVQRLPLNLLCQSDTEDMTWRDGEWE